jgi:hypothetical protein
MADVESNRLEEDHTFVTKEDILNLRIAEEANLRCIKMKVERSDGTNFIVVGINFYAYVSGSLRMLVGQLILLSAVTVMIS